MRALLSRVKTEMSFCLSIPGTSQQEHILSIRGQLGQLVESVACSLGASNSVFGCLGELQSNNSKSFGDVEKSGIVGNCSDDGDNAFKLIISLSGR